MRIVLVNWARIWDGTARGGGVNGYCQALALELVGRGHQVVALCGGTTYEPERGSRRIGPCLIQRHPDWLGIRIFEVINSPVLAPALAQFRDPASEITSPALEAEVEALMRQLAPDAVHFHNIEGFSAGCVAAVRRGAPAAAIFFSLHNWHTICPQVYLMQGHRRPCRDFANGRNCTNCIPTVDPAQEKRRLAFGGETAQFTWQRREEDLDNHAGNPATPAEPTGAVRQLLRRARQAAIAVRAGHIAPPPFAPSLTDPRSVPLEVLEPMPIQGDDTRGQTSSLLQAQRPHPWSPQRSQIPAWRPLLNTIEPEPPAADAPNTYALRRQAMIAMLNSCDGVLAVSSYVHRKFDALGVDRRLLRTVHIGSPLPALIARRPEAIFPPPPFDPLRPRPLRLVFAGYNNWYKGLPMLADSLELLTPEILSRIHLFVYALNGQEIEPQLRRLETRLAALTLRNGYQQEDLPWLLGGMDLGIVPSVWWDNGPQTVMEFLACGIPVLAAELGGIPDFVCDGHNGLLFCGNDRWDLARRIAHVVREPALLERLRTNIRPPKSIAEHAAELERLYSDPLS
jgi:glycosyltransferase involved in cell wall biosynthesis